MLRVTLKPLLAAAKEPPPEEMLRLRPEQLEPAQFVQLAARRLALARAPVTAPLHACGGERV